MQAAIVDFFDRFVNPEDAELFAVPNGEWRNKAVAGFLKAQGVRSGVLDLVLLAKSGAWLIETKRPATECQRAGTLSETQKAFIAKANRLGFQCRVVDSVEQFVAVLHEAGVRHRLNLALHPTFPKPDQI